MDVILSHFQFHRHRFDNNYFCFRDFFLYCDGIFLNYTWTESRLTNSRLLAKELGRDVKDIYVGLDVWGRGCPGGGGFNSAYVNITMLLLYVTRLSLL